ncbi:hypothetical protein [Burkholderia cenocepacia]|uniref:hypothetical protein n=1 Tax=Burkholderia cenocepacia TaxID=95486 RepID=UPI0009E104E1|nr:hypothetical protein [Burkholderia cenocepacia]ARF84227.1 hypothetical protein BCN122_I0840 [Burkholderia cenocepacia]MCW3675587.1 hypothetical protein [Burkholderia cenocepacia]MDC6086195.1 hypothetical protein [Burkholderia cenocepacia]
MNYQLGIFASDQVNRANTCISASELMASEERAWFERRAQDLPPGWPSHIQHDMHRAIGWSHVLGHLIDGAMVRVVGVTHQVETDEERADLGELIERYWQVVHHEGMDSIKIELSARLGITSHSDAIYRQIEAYTISRPGLAAELYPEFFDLDSQFVDKDGLTYYRELTARLTVLQPGVFLDPKKNVVLFAHRFFRRSLSHLNKLNDYFLTTFHRAATELESVTPRLRLDPDLIGHPDTVTNLLELEYWHGPKFNNDIQSIPKGAAEYKATDRVQFYEGVDKTHFWWKNPEVDKKDGVEDIFRTFEVEELIENRSGGLEGERYGCRYAHAECSLSTSKIRHFDGAIRAYPDKVYRERKDKMIDRAGKHSEYTKLFRFDGPLPVEEWKRLLSDFFRGNPLIPEYLGAQSPDLDGLTEQRFQPDPAAVPDSVSDVTELCALISLDSDGVDQPFCLESHLSAFPNGLQVLAAETGGGAIDAFLRSKTDLTNTVTMWPVEGVLHLARMCFGASETLPMVMRDVVSGVAKALPVDVETLGLEKASVTLTWPVGGIVVTLSLRGAVLPLGSLLNDLFSVVDPELLPSAWIEPLSNLVKRLAPRSIPTNNLWNVLEGTLQYQRSDEVERRLRVPSALQERLEKDGQI